MSNNLGHHRVFASICFPPFSGVAFGEAVNFRGKYVKGIRTKFEFAMFLVDGLLRAKWNSSFLDLETLYTFYVSKAKEADWRVDHIAQGARKNQILESLIHSCAR